jgi:hypothetical protein
MSAYTYHRPPKSKPISMKTWMDHVWHWPIIEYWSGKAPHLNWTLVCNISYFHTQNQKHNTCKNINVKFSQCWTPNPEILPTPEPQNCGLLGLGSQGSGVLELRTQYVRLDKDVYQKCVNQCVCKSNFIDLPKFPKSWVPTPEPRTLRPSSPQFQGSGVGKMFINIWKVDSNIFEKCLSSQMSSPKFQVSDFWVSGIRGPGTQDSICETGHRYLSKVWKSICF